MAQDRVQIGQQRAAAGQHDALVDDVGGQFRRGVLQRDLHRLDDLRRPVRPGFRRSGAR
jgi:hypothetical protein